MTPLRWLAAVAFALAILSRLARSRISFDVATRIAPGVHRGIPVDNILFWGLLALGAILLLITFLRPGR
jgi:hypothetical protein